MLLLGEGFYVGTLYQKIMMKKINTFKKIFLLISVSLIKNSSFITC